MKIFCMVIIIISLLCLIGDVVAWKFDKVRLAGIFTIIANICFFSSIFMFLIMLIIDCLG